MPETCAREALPCTLSPLGYHLTAAMKEKIVRGEFVDLLSLLPSAKESLFKDKKDERGDEDRRRLSRSFSNWLQAFLIYSSIICEKCPEKSVGLLQHVDMVAWFVYDESFRQKLAVHPNLEWGSKDIGLWLNLFLILSKKHYPR